MNDEPNELRDVLRALAAEDDRHAVEMHPRLLAEFRAMYQRRPSAAARAFGLALATAAAAVLAGAVWMAGRFGAPAGNRARAARSEVRTAFMPLAYSAVPFTEAHIVRLEVPRRALASFGLMPIETVDSSGDSTVVADVLVGEDGLARAVRFVPASHADGGTP